MFLKSATVLALLVSITYAAEFNLTVPNGNCGGRYDMMPGEKVTLTASGNANGSCSFTFQGKEVDNCYGVCIEFKDSSLDDCNVQFTAKTMGLERTFSCHNKPTGNTYCVDESMMEVVLKEKAKYDPAASTYSLNAIVYTKCGDNKGKSITFEEAAKAAEGYHHGPEFHEKVKTNYITGIVLGFGMASVFLVILLIGWCYVRNNPNRGGKYSKPTEQPTA